MDSTKNQWWNRAAIAMFWIGFSMLFISATIVNWEDRPYTTTGVDDSRSYVQCNKDASQNLVYYFNKNFGFFTDSNNIQLSPTSKDRAKELCSKLTEDQQLKYSREETRLIESGVWNYSERDTLLKQYKEKLVGDTGYTYHIETKTTTYGSWGDVIKYEILILLGIFVGMYFVSSVYNYIVFGETFRNPLFYWKIIKK